MNKLMGENHFNKSVMLPFQLGRSPYVLWFFMAVAD